MSHAQREVNDAQKPHGSPVTAAEDAPARHRHRVTPLPMRQMLPMTFVLLNESVCSTMLLPFVGYLVSHLKGTPVEEAGYESGMLIGVFMLGQMVSAKPWGWVSDKYGRRFPIISGLFTSGLMMLGFGMGTSVWMCALFRFFHGLFNGNVLVAKTMMADITDKTNQAKGFAFVSLCYGIGILIGPVLGGLLYDPAHSSALRWAHISTDSILSRHPALLPSLVIFVYTNIGMTICTFFVMESNPKAQPLPRLLAYIYPCFWREPEMFVHPSTTTSEEENTEEGRKGAPSSRSSGSGEDDDDDSDDVLGASIRTAERLVANVALTRAVASLEVASPVRREGRRFHNHLVGAENLTHATARTTAVTPRYGQSTLATLHERSGGATDADESDVEASATVCASKPNPTSTASSTREERSAAAAAAGSAAENATGDVDGTVVVVDATDGVGMRREEEDEEGATTIKSFGYREAFACPVTRMMLIVYMLLSAADMTVQEILSLWAIAKTSVGGLGFGADLVGYILLSNSVPCVVSNLLFHKACTHYDNKLSLFRLSVACCGVAISLLPFISYFELGNSVFFVVVICTSIRQFFASWAYGVVTMLTARSAPDGHVGAIMGINQSCGALTRTLVPFLVTPLFAWSITSHHSFPFNHVFVFLLSAIGFGMGYVYSIGLRTDADSRLEVVEENPAWMAKIKEVVGSCYEKVRDLARRATNSCRSG